MIFKFPMPQQLANHDSADNGTETLSLMQIVAIGVGGLILAMIPMHFLVIRPLINRLAVVQDQLSQVGFHQDKMMESTETVSKANMILSSLQQQHDQIAGARATLNQMQQLRREIEVESHRLPDTKAAIDRISELPKYLMEAEIKQGSTLLTPFQGDDLKISPVDTPVALQKIQEDRLVTTDAVVLPGQETVPNTEPLSFSVSSPNDSSNGHSEHQIPPLPPVDEESLVVTDSAEKAFLLPVPAQSSVEAATPPGLLPVSIKPAAEVIVWDQNAKTIIRPNLKKSNSREKAN